MSDSSTEKVQVALAIHDATGLYVRQTTVVLASIFANTQSRIVVHLMHDATLSAEGKRYLQAFCDSYQQELILHYVQMELDLKKYATISVYSPACLFRLKLVSLLPNLAKVIYLDTDIIFRLDIKELWEQDLHGALVGGVRDLLSIHQKECECQYRIFRKTKVLSDSYINSGVMLFDLAKIRHTGCDYEGQAFTFLKKYPQIIYLDQDALNFAYRGQIFLLPQRFNMVVCDLDSQIWEDIWGMQVIWHFTGCKPWEARVSKVDILYWQYYRLTPWGSDFTTFVDSVQRAGYCVEDVLQNGKILHKKDFLLALSKRLLKEIWLFCKNKLRQ
jgi:lipopolysaccharide biosynthesis glycosyltransferase